MICPLRQQRGPFERGFPLALPAPNPSLDQSAEPAVDWVASEKNGEKRPLNVKSKTCLRRASEISSGRKLAKKLELAQRKP
jgi:hypothetical protein